MADQTLNRKGSTPSGAATIVARVPYFDMPVRGTWERRKKKKIREGGGPKELGKK